MGFDEKLCMKSVQQYGNKIEKCIEFISKQQWNESITEATPAVSSIKTEEKSYDDNNQPSPIMNNFAKTIESVEQSEHVLDIVATVMIPIVIHCPGNDKFNYKMKLVRPYNKSDACSISNLISDIMNEHHKYTRRIFIVSKIKSPSFIEEKLYNDEDHQNDLIIDYRREIVETIGIALEVDLANIRIPITVTWLKNANYNLRFILIKPMTHNDHHKYTLKDIISDIMAKHQQQHPMLNFVPCKVKSSSFIEKDINYLNYHHFHDPIIVTDYPQSIVEQFGIDLEISIGVKIPINIQCPRNKEFGHHFTLYRPYDDNYEYSIKDLVSDIMEKQHQKHPEYTFIPSKICASFIGPDVNYQDVEWFSFTKITQYPLPNVIESGMEIEIDLEIYQHKVNSYEVKCNEIKAENNTCPIYSNVRYQDIFTEQYLDHLREYQHDTEECKHGDECYAFKRVVEGEDGLKDRCHVIIYTHPPRGRDKRKMEDGINSFCLNDEWADNHPLYYATEQDKTEKDWNEQDGYLSALIEEVIENGYKADLCKYCANGYNAECKHDDYSVLEIVNDKLNCMRHKLMGSPLNRSEMLSILLYTAGDSNYDLCRSQRNGDYSKWKWLDYCLYHAIHKLSKREYASYKIYTGLGGTKLINKYIDCGYFKTYVSTSWMREIAESFADDEGMLFEIDAEFREEAVCCDISWISKFGMTECEVLIARSVDAVFNRFECRVMDEKNGIQIVSLRLYQGVDAGLYDHDGAATNRLNDIYKRSAQENTTVLAQSEPNVPVLPLQNTMQRVIQLSETYRNMVRLFCNNAIHQILPMDIHYVICVYCGHEDRDTAGIVGTPSEHELNGFYWSSKHQIIRCTSSTGAVARWNIPIYTIQTNFHAWAIKAVKMSSKNSKLIIGLQCKSSNYPSKFFGINSDGTLIINEETKRDYESTFQMKQGTSIYIIYDFRKRTLWICTADAQRMIENVNHDNYNLSIHITRKDDKLMIQDYKDKISVISPTIKMRMTSIFEQFEIKATEFKQAYKAAIANQVKNDQTKTKVQKATCLLGYLASQGNANQVLALVIISEFLKLATSIDTESLKDIEHKYVSFNTLDEIYYTEIVGILLEWHPFGEIIQTIVWGLKFAYETKKMVIENVATMILNSSLLQTAAYGVAIEYESKHTDLSPLSAMSYLSKKIFRIICVACESLS